MPHGPLVSFLQPYAALLRRSESREALHAYVAGLQLPSASKTASQIARLVSGTSSQRLQEFLTRTSWDERAMDAIRIRQLAERAVREDAAIVLTQVVIPKAGTRSVGASRQCRGPRGGLVNCQRIVVAHYVDAQGHWPLLARLYLPASWLEDEERRRVAHIPPGLAYRTPAAIALELLAEVRALGVRAERVVVDRPLVEEDFSLPRALADADQSFVVALPDAAAVSIVDPRAPDLGTTPDVEELSRRIPASLWSPAPSVETGARVGRREIATLRARLEAGTPPIAGMLAIERGGGAARRAVQAFFATEDAAREVPLRARQIELARAFYEHAAAALGLRDYEGRHWHGLHRHLALVMLAAAYQQRQDTAAPARRA